MTYGGEDGYNYKSHRELGWNHVEEITVKSRIAPGFSFSSIVLNLHPPSLKLRRTRPKDFHLNESILNLR